MVAIWKNNLKKYYHWGHVQIPNAQIQKGEILGDKFQILVGDKFHFLEDKFKQKNIFDTLTLLMTPYHFWWPPSIFPIFWPTTTFVELACRWPMVFPIIPNLFFKTILYTGTLSWGIREYDHLRHVTKFRREKCYKSSPVVALCITSYRIMLKTYFLFYAYHARPFLYNSSSKFTIYRQISIFSGKNRAKIEAKSSTFST